MEFEVPIKVDVDGELKTIGVGIVSLDSGGSAYDAEITIDAEAAKVLGIDLEYVTVSSPRDTETKHMLIAKRMDKTD